MSDLCHLGTDVGNTFTDPIFYTAAGEIDCRRRPCLKGAPRGPGAFDFGPARGEWERRCGLAAE